MRRVPDEASLAALSARYVQATDTAKSQGGMRAFETHDMTRPL
jgi:hypothetical protein